MKKLFLLLLLFPFLLGCSQKEKEFTVLQWNIWQEGTVIPGGYDAIVNEIARLRPDFVTLSEVRNYENTNFTARLVQSLKEKGETYYSFYTYDTGLLSRYPITDSLTVFPEKNDHGSIYRLTADMNGQKIAVYTAHLDYLDDAYYNVRGYDGSTWEEIPIPTTVEEVLKRNVASQRDDAIRLFIEQAIPWTVPVLLDEAGLKDAYREFYPDVLNYPGFTYPSDNPAKPADKITWAPKADERDRIDYIWYYPEKGLKVKDAAIFGPKNSIVRAQRVQETSKDKFIEPLGVWPTDHKGVLVTFQYPAK